MMLKLAIYIYGDQLQPELITKLLKVEPSEVQVKGGPRYMSKRHPAKIGVWMLSTECDAKPFCDQLEELLNKIKSAKIALDKIKGVQFACLDILATDDDSTTKDPIEFTLSNDQLRALAELGLSVRTTVM